MVIRVVIVGSMEILLKLRRLIQRSGPGALDGVAFTVDPNRAIFHAMQAGEDEDAPVIITQRYYPQRLARRQEITTAVSLVSRLEGIGSAAPVLTFDLVPGNLPRVAELVASGYLHRYGDVSALYGQ